MLIDCISWSNFANYQKHPFKFYSPLKATNISQQLVLITLVEQVKRLANVKIPLLNVALILDQVAPPVLATKLISPLRSLDNRLRSLRRRPSTRNKPRADLNALLQRLQPHRTSNTGQALQAFRGEIHDSLENGVCARAFAVVVALAVGVGGGDGIVAGAGHGVGRTELAAGPKAVAVRGVDVVAADALLGEDGVGLVVSFPGHVAAGDGGRGVLGLGKEGAGEDQWQGAGEGEGRGEDVGGEHFDGYVDGFLRYGEVDVRLFDC